MNSFSPDIQDDGNLSRIGAIAKEFDITLRALRFYEDKGLIAPKRVGATRLYSKRERARIKLIILGRNIGFSLEDIREMLNLYEPTSGNVAQMRIALEKADQQLERLNEQRSQLDQAIAALLDATNLVQGSLTKAIEKEKAHASSQ